MDLHGRVRPAIPVIASLVLAGAVSASLVAPGRAPALGQPAAVSVFPIPGSRVASPQTQIAFRGIPASAIGSVQVVGSRSGVHTGTIEADSDGNGGSFLPSVPFTAGETVTVTTQVNVIGARKGTFQFTVATPAGAIPYRPAHRVARVPGDVTRFRSRLDLAPAAVKLLKRSDAAAPGDIFLAPQFGPVQNGPEILDSRGNLVWFDRVPRGDAAADFAVQRYQGKTVLTWWQGYSDAGIGIGEDVIYSSSYQPVAVVRAANGLGADLHDFQITPQGTALITAYYPVYWNATSVHGSSKEIVLDSVVQEIDIPTGLVLFQWDSLDHVRLSASYEPLPHQGGAHGNHDPFDYFHVNSVQQDDDGDLIVSGRNTWAAYKVSDQTGAVLWTLGGKHSSFKMQPGSSFAFQHDVRVQAARDLFVTIFDDGAGPPTVHSQSRGIKLVLNFKGKTARIVGQLEHSPPLLADFEGNLQQLPDGHDFVGWGQQPYFSEYDAHGRLVLDGRFVGDTSSYRAFRFPWTGTPAQPPDVAAARTHRRTTVYASWNGATEVASWRVLGGASAKAMRVLRTAPRRGFETAIATAPARYVEVQALDSRGHVLGSSAVTRAA